VQAYIPLKLKMAMQQLTMFVRIVMLVDKSRKGAVAASVRIFAIRNVKPMRGLIIREFVAIVV